jgi:hypothetical protein
MSPISKFAMKLEIIRDVDLDRVIIIGYEDKGDYWNKVCIVGSDNGGEFFPLSTTCSNSPEYAFLHYNMWKLAYEYTVGKVYIGDTIYLAQRMFQ